jgi:Family of unknown function (DUF5670)
MTAGKAAPPAILRPTLTPHPLARALQTTPPVPHERPEEGTAMLWTIFVILLVLWLLGMVSSYTLGGFIHILLVLAIVVVLIRVIQGRNPV